MDVLITKCVVEGVFEPGVGGVETPLCRKPQGVCRDPYEIIADKYYCVV